MTYEGEIVRSPVEGGQLLLDSGGKRYALKGGDRGLYKVGQRVKVQGRIDRAAVGIGMTGDPVISVSSYEVVS